MPGYRGHLIGGTLLYLGMLQLFRLLEPTPHLIFQGFLFCLLGSLFPDIDIKSKGQKVFYGILLFFLLYCLYARKWNLFITVSLLGLIPMLVRHRGLFHRIWFLLGLSLGIFLVLSCCYQSYQPIILSNSIFFFAGSFSHIFLDRLVSRLKRYFS